MDDHSLVHGVLFYTSVYINAILCSVAILTGRWVFMLLVVLSVGLTAYMMYMTTHNSEHLKVMGKWMENTFAKIMERYEQWKSPSP